MENRISVKLKSPNPLFEKWLTEWREKAREKNSKTQHAYSLALDSLRKYPLPLEKGRDCKILKGFGTKVCDMLDEALENYKIESNQQNIKVPTAKNKKSKTPPKLQQKSIDSNIKCEYIPTYRSGAYSILFALYKKSLENNYPGSMLKKDLIEEAQPYCDTSFTKPKVGSFYTSWSSMKILISKKLVHKEGNPAKFSLTDTGFLLGCKLYTQRNNSLDNRVPSISNFEKETNFEQRTFSSKEKDLSQPTYNDNECVFLSDSEDEGTRNNNCVVSEQGVSISNELKEICGIFSNEIDRKDKALAEPNKVTVGVSTLNNLMNEKSIKNKKISHKISEYEEFIMAPYTFDVILFVDTQETSGRQTESKNDAILSELERLNVNYEVRNLKVGDYCWICRHKISGKEFIAPYIIERKRMDDLASSIKDGRFHEQKFRIKQCGLKNVIYMIESYGTKDEHVGLPLKSLNQAIVNTLIQDGFTIKIVEGVRGLAEYLSCMSNLIKKNYERKTIVSCPKENISDISITDDLVSLMYFLEFNKLSSKTKNFSVKEMFIRQLLQTKGLSVDKALAIVKEYQTPKLFKDMIIANDRKSVNIISNIKYGKLGKKIGPLLSENLYMFYTKMSF